MSGFFSWLSSLRSASPLSVSAQLPRVARAGLLLGSFVVYGAAFLLLNPSLGPAASALVILPVVLAAWWQGLRGGMLACLIALLLNVVLFNVVGLPGLDMVFRRGGPGTLALFLAGALVGRMSDLSQRLYRQVAETKRAEKQVGMLSRALEQAADGVIITDIDGIIQYANPAWTKMTGYAKEEVIGRTPRIVKSGRHDLAFYQRLWDTILAGHEWRAELVNKRQDGQLIDVEQTITPIFGDRGVITHFVAVERDVSDRKRAEEALRASEIQFRTLVEQSPFSTQIFGPDGSTVTVNRAFCTLWGASREDREHVIRAYNLLQDEQLEAAGLMPYIRRAFAGEFAEIPAIRYDPKKTEAVSRIGLKPRWVVGYAWPILDEGGKLRQVVLMHEDISARMQAEAQLQSRLAEMEAVHRISTALRTAQTLDAMVPRLLDETLAVLGTDAGAIWLFEAAHDELRIAVARGWFAVLGERPMTPGEGIAGHVFETGEPYLSPEFARDPRTRRAALSQIPSGWGGACIPIHSVEATVGVLFVSVQLPRELRPEEAHLLTTLAEIAGNAIHRTRLHAQTEQRLQRLAALHTIDQAIGAGVDLGRTLNVLLEQVTAHLRVDAADVLLLDPRSLTLEYAAGLGFRTDALTPTRLGLGQGLAGRAALECRVMEIRDWRSEAGLTDLQSLLPKFQAEGIVAYCGVPLIAKGQVKGVLEIFHRAPLGAEPEWSAFLATLAGQAAIAIADAQLFDGLQRSNAELAQAYTVTIEGWGRALELRDRETEGHTRRVTEMTLALARATAMDEAEIVHLRRGALLHDIGKMGVPDSILLKPGPLTDDEWVTMRQHPVYAYEMLAPIAYLRPALDIPYCHHERWDGSGYPRGLKGEETPLAARLFAVADVWDALTTDRPYRAAWPAEEARGYLRGQAGKLFDPRVVDLLFHVMEGRDLAVPWPVFHEGRAASPGLPQNRLPGPASPH